MLNASWIPLITIPNTWGFEQYPNDGIEFWKWKKCPETIMAKLGILASCQKMTYRQYFLLITVCQYPVSEYHNHSRPNSSVTNLLNHTQPMLNQQWSLSAASWCTFFIDFQQSTSWNFRPRSSSGNHVRLTNLQGRASLRRRRLLRVSAKNQLQIRTLEV